MITTTGQFADKLMRAMNAELTKKLSSPAFVSSIRRGSKRILEHALRVQPTFLSMVNQDGKLRAELGVVNSVSAMDSLVHAWVKSTEVRVGRPQIIGNRLVGTRDNTLVGLVVD
jgi:hypothetical protein